MMMMVCTTHYSRDNWCSFSIAGDAEETGEKTEVGVEQKKINEFYL